MIFLLSVNWTKNDVDKTLFEILISYWKGCYYEMAIIRSLLDELVDNSCFYSA